MKEGDLSPAAAKLRQAFKRLRERWDAISDQWQDAKQRELREDVLAPLEPLVLAATDRMNHLAQVFWQIRHDCTEHT